MKILNKAFGFLLILSISKALFAANYQSEIGAVLDEKHVPFVLNQCSRSAPQNVTGTWKPDKNDIKTFEYQLFPILKKAKLSKIADRFNDYRLQYFGIIVDGQRVIYINAFLFSGENAGSFYIGPAPETCTAKHISWRNCPIVACDGSAAFWGIQYFVDSGFFNFFSSNGPAFVQPDD